MSRHSHPRRFFLTAIAGLCLVLGFRSGYAAPTAAPVEDSRQAVYSGAELERGRKWLDAIEHYEKATKAWPDNKELEYGLRRAKIHFSVERRYSDNSFHKQIRSLSRNEALALFDEVLTKVQSHYVDQVTPTSFVAHGTESFYLALSDDRYLQVNMLSGLKAEANRLRQTLRDDYWNKPINYRDGARAVIAQVCDLAESQLGLPAAPVIMEYVFGGCNSLDDYSGYLTPSRLSDLYGNIEGQFVGLGIEMKAEIGKGLLLVNVLPDSPASEGGLQGGDHIVGIDGRDCRPMTTDEAAGLLQGLEGSRVTIERERAGEVRSLNLVRRAVVVKSIPVVKIIDRDQGIGYIQMNSFQKSSAEELDAALETLHKQGMRSLIWDLRGNPGGLLTAAVETLDRFIADGVLVSTRGRTSDQNWSYSAHRTGTWNMPLALLIDGDSASASEIVAGAVRDHRRGRIVGRKSYGKWSVQSIYPVAKNSGLRLTTAKFYSPAGHTLGKIGVYPDAEVAQTEKVRTHYRGANDIDFASDEDVQKALELLRKTTASR